MKNYQNTMNQLSRTEQIRILQEVTKLAQKNYQILITDQENQQAEAELAQIDQLA